MYIIVVKMAKLISVFGATGAQGGPIARTLLQNGFRVRVVTRNPDSKKAKALITAGAEEAVYGNYDDVESVKVAITGAYGVFYITNYWELFAINATTAYEREIAQGKVVADVCKAAGIQHVVYSGSDAVKEKTGIPCPDLDAKAVVEKYIDEIGLRTLLFATRSTTRISLFFFLLKGKTTAHTPFRCPW